MPFCTFHELRPAPALATRREPMLTGLRQRIRDVRQGPDGFIYCTTDMPHGAVLKIEPVEQP
jgi:glucose/arabinose dehydrogenase